MTEFELGDRVKVIGRAFYLDIFRENYCSIIAIDPTCEFPYYIQKIVENSKYQIWVAPDEITLPYHCLFCRTPISDKYLLCQSCLREFHD